jgi:hypothetical protein
MRGQSTDLAAGLADVPRAGRGPHAQKAPLGLIEQDGWPRCAGRGCGEA